ncbi:MAG: hypothetical protein ACUVYA_11735 [Planctomycetota bacterium]
MLGRRSSGLAAAAALPLLFCGGIGSAAEQILLRLNRAQFLLGEPIFCLLRVGEPGAALTLRRVRCEYRILDERGEVLGVTGSAGEGWCPAEVRPLLRSRRELMFTLWRVGCGGPGLEEPTLSTAAVGKYTLEVRAAWWLRLVEVPWVSADPVRFEVRERTEEASKGREFADLAFSLFRVGSGAAERERLLEFFWEAPPAYKPYAAWLLVRAYRSTDLFEGHLPRTVYGDIAEALEAMRGARVAEFPNEFEEAAKAMELLQFGLARDLEGYMKCLREYAQTYRYCGLLEGEDYDRAKEELVSEEFREKRAPSLAALSEEEAKDLRTKIERAAALSLQGRRGEAESAEAERARSFESDAKSRADAVESLGDETLPREAKGAIVRALAHVRFPERDMFLRDCAMGKYGDNLRWPALRSLGSVARRDAEVAVIKNLEDLLDGYHAPSVVFDVAVELKVLRARQLLKALAEEGNEAAKRAYEELEKAAGGGKTGGNS